MPVIVRDAGPADLATICAIHNAEGIATTASWGLADLDVAHWGNLLADQRTAGRPLLVAELDGRVVGYAYYAPFRSKGGWAPTVEHSVYLDRAAHGHGTGRALMTELIARASAAGVHTMVGVLDAGNASSAAFHRALGFEQAGLLREAGHKFGGWRDAAFWTLRLP